VTLSSAVPAGEAVVHVPPPAAGRGGEDSVSEGYLGGTPDVEWRSGRSSFTRAPSLDHNPLDLIERDDVGRAVVELGSARALMRSHRLRVFERSAGFEIGGDARGAEGVTTDFDLQACVGRSTADHSVDVDAMHRQAGENARLANCRAEEGSTALAADPGGTNVLVEVGLELVVGRHLVPLSALLVESEPPALAFGVVVVDAHADHGADPGERVGHDGDQRAVAQTYHAGRIHALEELARLVGHQDGCLAALDHMLGPAHRMRRVSPDHLAGDQPIEDRAV
jgi:hypothetical protein